MRHRRKRTVHEINLTPLLDVLFSILFIVMMTGMQNETNIKENYQQQITELTQALDTSEKEKSSYDLYQKEAVIITVSNTMKNGNHYLMMHQGLDKTELASIQMGIEKIQNMKMRIESIIRELVDTSDNQPIYIVFYCNKKQIYTAEYKAVVEIMNQLQTEEKEVFFKVMEEELNEED